jgi:hypothetical protein
VIRDSGKSLLLPIAGVVIVPLVIAGYVALTLFVFLPLLALRSLSRLLGFAAGRGRLRSARDRTLVPPAPDAMLRTASASSA